MAKWSLLGIGALARATAFFVLWLLLVDGTDEPNLIIGGACAVLASVLATIVQSLRTVHVRPRPSMLRYAYRLFILLFTDSVRVLVALLKHLVLRRRARGSFRAVRYRAVSADYDDVGRRLLTEWGASLAANRYVIGIDRQRHLLLVHELVPTSGSLDPLDLG